MPASATAGLVATAADYLARGLSVIPLEPNGKKPAYDLLPRHGGKPGWEEFQHRQASPEELAYWFTRTNNIGIVCGEVSGGLVVIDFDSLDSFDGWIEQEVSRWLIPAVSTSHGRHVYFRSLDQVVGNRRNVQKQVDLRGEGGYVVAPPSLHPTGWLYQWVMGSQTCIPELTLAQAGVEELFPPGQPTKGEQPKLVDGLPYSILPFVRGGTFLGNRDRKAYWAACECRDHGVAPSAAIDAIAHGLSLSQPDLDPILWATEKVRSAYARYSSST